MSEQQSTKSQRGKLTGRGGRGSAKTGKSKKPISKIIKETSEEGVGVSKIKAALRQTKRLLAKDNLSASVKQEAERKLIALEDELQTKETQQKEKKNAQRSHKIRFFERQKLVRRIKKLKKVKEEGGEEDVDNNDLLEARVLLNYVLHYPMTQKYVALFPNQGPSSMEEAEETEKEENASNEKASKIKERVRDSMKKGHLSNEPEMELELRSDQQTGPRKRLQEDDEQPRREKKSKLQKSNLEDDDFFAISDE